MNKKAAFLVAGTLAGTFAFSAGLWSLYPENREMVAGLGRSVGLLASQPEARLPAAVFIRTGGTPSTRYQPAAAAQGCSADGKIMRLIYRIAISEDTRREEILNHPRVTGNLQKYETLRREAVVANMQDFWQAEAAHFNAETGEKTGAAGRLTGLDFTNPQTASALQGWLQDTASRLYQDEGLKVAFEVNSLNGLQILDAPAGTINACRPAPAPR